MENMFRNTTWHGTEAEAADLLSAIGHHCACEPGDGVTTVVCPAHAMLVHEQRSIDGLLFARKIAARLVEEEFHPRMSLTELAH